MEYLVSTSLEVTSKPNLKNRESNVSNNSTPHLVGIIVSLVVIVILVIVVALLVYKIKMYKLKQKYETRLVYGVKQYLKMSSNNRQPLNTYLIQGFQKLSKNPMIAF